MSDRAQGVFFCLIGGCFGLGALLESMSGLVIVAFAGGMWAGIGTCLLVQRRIYGDDR